MNVKELNGRLGNQAYVSGHAPSKDDAEAFTAMFGTNNNVIQWAAQMAAYYQSERAALLKPAASAASAAAASSGAAKATPAAKPAGKGAAAKPAAAAEEDIDLFGDETEEEKAAAAAKKAADAAARADKKKEKAPVIAKSSILMDIKPFDDTTDLEALAAKIKAIEKDGLLWGAHKLVPVAYGIKKLQLLIVIEDDKVSGDDIEDMISGFEDDVQSMDIVAWNKV